MPRAISTSDQQILFWILLGLCGVGFCDFCAFSSRTHGLHCYSSLSETCIISSTFSNLCSYYILSSILNFLINKACQSKSWQVSSDNLGLGDYFYSLKAESMTFKFKEVVLMISSLARLQIYLATPTYLLGLWLGNLLMMIQMLQVVFKL